ncbi:hypothetical protein D3C81_1751600 [compost metagenome]
MHLGFQVHRVQQGRDRECPDEQHDQAHSHRQPYCLDDVIADLVTLTAANQLRNDGRDAHEDTAKSGLYRDPKA